MDSASLLLPPASDLSPSILSLLNSKLRTNEDLTRAPNLVSELQSQCRDLDRTLIEFNRNLGSSLLAYADVSDRAHGVLGHVTDQLTALESSTRSRSSDGEGRVEQILGEELPALAKEVARVESVRSYAETALKLQTMIGDIEDAVSSILKKNSWKHSSKQNSEELRLVAIRTLKLTEDVLNSVTKSHPQWAHLVSAVDHRVDRALAILRPQAIADHRALLSSLGWPPPLSNSTAPTPDSGKSNHFQSLFSMEGDLKDQYCENFFALCSLQELQRRRKSRQLEGYNRELALHQPLWVIEELVNPISLASQRHFEKWIDKPELIFELVYKISGDYIDSMDELLQPLVYKAMLTGYDCAEEWISGMVSSLSTYLAKEIFPKYAQTDEDGVMSTQEQARISWLHLVDLMISFDKRIKTLIIEHTGIGYSMKNLIEHGLELSLEHSCKLSSLNIFCDRPVWLDLWAEMELNDILEKLKLETGNERNWTLKVQGASLLSYEDYKAPAISSAYLRSLSSVVDRSQALPRFSMRSRFLNLTGVPIIHKFVDCLLFRCQEAEGLTALTDNDALVKVANSINAARYFETVLKDWCVNLDKLGSSESDQPISVGEPDGKLDSVDCIKSGIFDKEIVKLEEFRVEWAEKLCVVILRGFDAQCRDYVKNKRQWQEKGEDGWALSRCLVGALDYLQGKTTVVEVHLNQVDFRGVWRSLAGGIDRMFFGGILMNNVKFHDGGVEKFGSDVEVIYGAFRGWCKRPEVLFPKVSEGLKLLRMGAEQLQNSLAGEEWMKENGIKYLSLVEAEKIVKSRVFTS